MQWGRADCVKCVCYVFSKSEFYSPVEIFFSWKDGLNEPRKKERGMAGEAEKGCVCTLSHFSHVWLFATPWTVAFQVPPSMGFSRQEDNWSELSCHPPGGLPHPGIEPASFVSCIGRWVPRRGLSLSFLYSTELFRFLHDILLFYALKEC